MSQSDPMTNEQDRALCDAAERRACVLHAAAAWGIDGDGFKLDKLSARIRELSQSITEAEALADRLAEALGDVIDPLGYLRRTADAEGSKLSGAAYAVANDPGFVRSIAESALAAHTAARAK